MKGCANFTLIKLVEINEYFMLTGKMDKVRDALYGNTATTSTKASPSFNSQERDMYDEHEVRSQRYLSNLRLL